MFEAPPATTSARCKCCDPSSLCGNGEHDPDSGVRTTRTAVTATATKWVLGWFSTLSTGVVQFTQRKCPLGVPLLPNPGSSAVITSDCPQAHLADCARCRAGPLLSPRGSDFFNAAGAGVLVG